MKLTTEQIKQMIVEELRSLMDQEESEYKKLLDELAAEIKQYNFAFLRNSPLFGDLWKMIMKERVRSAVPNMMPYVIEKVIGVWSAFAKKPGDPKWNAKEAVGELKFYLENAQSALEELASANTSHYNFSSDFSSDFRKEHFGGFGFRAVFGKLIKDVNKRLPESKMVKDIPVTLWMGGWRKHLADLVPEYYDFMRAIVEIVPMALEEPDGMLADLLLSGEPESVVQALELFGAL